jgi:hypothetical protein
VKEIGMPIDPATLARHLSSLASLDAEHDLPRAMQQLTSATKALLGVDGAGLMLADERGQLRWATASDQEAQVIEEGQERLGQGPCVNAFAEHAPMAMRDAEGTALGQDHRRGHWSGDAGRPQCSGAAGRRPHRQPRPVLG